MLTPLGLSADATWWTDCVPYFFIRTAGDTGRSQQGNVMRDVYDPFRRRRRLPQAMLPPRPSDAGMFTHTLPHEGARLKHEMAESAPTKLLITLGEVPAHVLTAIADEVKGPPAQRLSLRASYGQEGSITIRDVTAPWLALIHPGNMVAAWRARHQGWVAELR